MLLVQPTPEQQVHIRKEFKENPETTKRDLEAIKKWLFEEPHLPDTWDEHRLLSFLRGCKFCLATCKKKLDMYFTVRTAYPEFFARRDIRNPELQSILELMDGGVLPDLTPDGKRISIIKATRRDFETPNIADWFKIVFMIGDLRLEMEETGVLGDVYILDADIPLSKHFLKINPMVLKRFFECVQEAYPVIIKEVHIVNASPFVAFILNVVKPFLNLALKDAIHVHTKIETLYEFIPVDILPEDYGGKAGRAVDVKNRWIKKVEENSAWFEEQEDIKADETKRLRKPAFYNVWGWFGF